MSQQDSKGDNTQTASVIKRNRFFGLVIIAIVTAPMLIAYIMYQTGWGVSVNTTNNGELISPALPIQALVLSSDRASNGESSTEANGKVGNELTALFDKDELSKEWSKKWRLLVPVNQNCTEVCQQNLYTTRQVHIRLAEKAYRVERIILSLDELPSALEQQLREKHPNTRRIDTTAASFAQWLAPANIDVAANDHYYLVDQEGFAMMRYDSSHTGQNLLDDIKKLLKFTYDK
jgi:cytochrome oxidase Cu insertion factor (SCO1/SenC/PrrC family)